MRTVLAACAGFVVASTEQKPKFSLKGMAWFCCSVAPLPFQSTLDLQKASSLSGYVQKHRLHIENTSLYIAKDKGKRTIMNPT